jgi:aminoglycoside phosphotransferase (APT) family kinase protein
VHGDYSPKNVLVHRDRLVLLDHEVIHFGDPGFDVGFALAHLLSKAHHVVAARDRLAEAAHLFWRSYARPQGEARAARHTLGCALARVAGRSPVEYLGEAERARQRAAVLALMADPPTTVPAVIDAFLERVA